MTSPRIRKSVASLTLGDLRAYAVWEFALDEDDEEGQDETTVRPYRLIGTLDPGDGMFVVLAAFRLADGTRASGYLTPTRDHAADLSATQPVIVTGFGQVAFWCGSIQPRPSEVHANYDRLGKQESNSVFPIAFESLVPLVGGPVRGTIPGFVVLIDWKTMTTRVAR